MPLAFPALIITGAVFFAGLYLVMVSLASSSTDRPRAESSGVLAGLTWVTDLAGKAWHKLVRATYSHFAESHLVPLVRWFGSLNALVLGVATTLADSAEAEAAAAERLTGKVIPSKIAAKVQPVAHTAKTAARSAHTANVKASSTSTALTHYRTAQHVRNAHYGHAVDITLPGRITNVRDDLDTLSRDEKALRERTKALESGAVKTFEWIRAHPLSGVTGVFAGAVAVALARLGFGFLRCRAWRDAGRKVTCGMGHWISDLLTAIATYALAGLAVLDPEVLAEAAVKAVDEIEPLLARMLD